MSTCPYSVIYPVSDTVVTLRPVEARPDFGLAT
jgi:hypothetical protein